MIVIVCAGGEVVLVHTNGFYKKAQINGVTDKVSQLAKIPRLSMPRHELTGHTLLFATKLADLSVKEYALSPFNVRRRRFYQNGYKGTAFF